MNIRIKLAGLIIGLLTIAISIGTIAYTNKSGPMKLVSICTGLNTQVVKCTWIPLEEKHRTIQEKEIAKQALKD